MSRNLIASHGPCATCWNSWTRSVMPALRCVLAMNLDTGTPTGKLMLNVLGSVAEFERAMMLERQREGIAKAKSEGKYIGRKPTALAKAGEVKALAAKGVRAIDIAKRLGICRASVYRALRVA